MIHMAILLARRYQGITMRTSLAITLTALGCGGASPSPPVVATAPSPLADAAAPAVDWAAEGQWVESCSCAMPCPCWDSKMPTIGHCDELMFFHVDKGHYGAAKLDGVDVVLVAQSTDGKTMDKSMTDKDMPVANLYVSSALPEEVASAAGKVVDRLAFSMSAAARKHAIKRVDLKARVTPDELQVDIAGVLTLRVTAVEDDAGRAKPYPVDVTSTGFLGKGTQGVSLAFDFHDDGVSWSFRQRNSTFAPFRYSADRGPLPWEPGFKAPQR
jgi:hypothetical protein